MRRAPVFAGKINGADHTACPYLFDTLKFRDRRQAVAQGFNFWREGLNGFLRSKDLQAGQSRRATDGVPAIAVSVKERGLASRYEKLLEYFI